MVAMAALMQRVITGDRSPNRTRRMRAATDQPNLRASCSMPMTTSNPISQLATDRVARLDIVATKGWRTRGDGRLIQKKGSLLAVGLSSTAW